MPEKLSFCEPAVRLGSVGRSQGTLIVFLIAGWGKLCDDIGQQVLVDEQVLLCDPRTDIHFCHGVPASAKV